MSDSTLAGRVPGESLMAALRDAVGPEGPTSFASRLFGHSPIPSTARSWYVGLLGEQAVAERLRRLPEGWLVLHSVPVGDRGSDIDHVLVSPSGRVLTLNTKHSPGGKVWVSPKAFLVNGQRQPYLRNSSHEAARAAKLLSAATGETVDALAVIVVVGATVTNKGEPKDVAVVTIDQLLRFLTRALAASRGSVPADAVRHAALQPGTWARSQPLRTPSTNHIEWFTGLRDRERQAARRRKAWVLGSLAVIVGLPAAAGVVTVVGATLHG
ncbi:MULTISPECIES: nuclease-related domain-containing protein [unclassified Frondihabitans]|uniref:nuclease-related domain-containing protein n=1 Tax=unclassified Frondihabitans TaxID=2626248 RepID=UPI000F50AC75|nr:MULTISPECIES: nuclease-related domain-containing protein [unclassified Frondihabitans]RPE78086.1 nuclease-like protein [Frondihabitans sp. PhB153]RPF08366.1 nuclease-like protein [Frondihabitans sp. PhB161]